MKVLVYNPNATDTSKLSLEEAKKPILSANNAIVKITGVGVCGSDLVKLNQSLVKPGTILGHEMVGIIDSISPEMSARYGFSVGDRIVSSHHVPCLTCDYCLRGQESLCASFKASNFNPGAFCEYLELSEGHLAHTVQKIPVHLSDEEASFTEPVACCIKAVENSRMRVNAQSVPSKNLVIGLGSIGLIMGQLLKHYYPNDEIVGLDLSQNRLKLAKELGFDRRHPEELNEVKRRQDPVKYDYIFLCAGADATIDFAIKHARDGATIVVFSSVPKQDLGFSNNDIYYKELNIMGSYSPNLSNLKESLELISKGKIKVNQLITHRTSIDELGKSIKEMQDEQGIKAFLKL